MIVANLRRLSDRHPDTLLVFENHDGASLDPEICRDILTGVDRPNIRMNFDPINFARAGVDPAAALATVRPLVAHVHLKGLDRGEFCEFGTGDVNLTPILPALSRTVTAETSRSSTRAHSTGRCGCTRAWSAPGQPQHRLS